MTEKITFTKEEKLKILKEVEQEGLKFTLEKHGIYPAKHNITKIEKKELYTIFWISEHYNPKDWDTYFERVR